MKIRIREQCVEDAAAVATLTESAFAASERGYNGEAALIGALQAATPSCMSWVATADEQLVGHSLFSPAELRRGREALRGMALAPMSVSPEAQRKGVGTKLIKEALREIRDLGCPFVIVLGHADYYPRFGFTPASEIDVRHGFASIPQELFFVRELSAGALDDWHGSAAYYRPEFGTQHAAE